MNKYLITKQIPQELLRDFEINMVGDKKCIEQLIVINGLKFGIAAGDENSGKGIKEFRIINESNEYPKIFVEYHKVLIDEEVADALGLEKGEWTDTPS